MRWGFFGDEDVGAFVLVVGGEDLLFVVAALGVDFPGVELWRQSVAANEIFKPKFAWRRNGLFFPCRSKAGGLEGFRMRDRWGLE
jgi:hypothetical protein